jgi:Zn-dependent hydrolases, including glyoxylases
MKDWKYEKGLHEIGSGVFAYLQPYRKGSPWGWSNAGLVFDGEESTLVDTLYDVRLTQEMYDTMRAAVPAAAHIDTVVNTHSNGDHTNGNQLFADATIITSLQAAEEMRKEPKPAIMANMAQHAPAGSFMERTLGPFHFEEVIPTYPTETFEGHKTLHVGDRVIELIEVGPAHTKGDILVYVPDEKIIYTGDIIFNDSHPVIWAGPIKSWLAACDWILRLDVDIVVPGHGPIASQAVAQEIKDYLSYIYAEAKKRHDAGMPMIEAAYDISLERYASWVADERMIPNVAAVYRELDQSKPENVHTLFALMDEWIQKKRK